MTLYIECVVKSDRHFGLDRLRAFTVHIKATIIAFKRVRLGNVKYFGKGRVEMVSKVACSCLDRCCK